MANLDWIFVGILCVSTLVGAWRGLVYEVLSLVVWAAAFVLAQLFAPQVAEMLPMAGASEVVRYGAAFALVFVAAVFAGTLLTWLVSKLFQVTGLRPADRALGAVFGLMRGLEVLMALVVLVTMTPLKLQPWWADSMTAPWVLMAVNGLKPVLPPEFGKHLP